MSIETLRALALAYAPVAEYPVCLDRETQLGIVGLRNRIAELQAERSKLESGETAPRQTIGEKPSAARIGDQIEALTADLAQAEEAARDNSIVLIFRRLPATPDSATEGEPAYSTLEADHTDARRNVNMDALAAALLPACYLRADSAHGDVGLTWAEASRVLDAGDLRQLRNVILGHHNMGAAIPFDPRPSGLPATT